MQEKRIQKMYFGETSRSGYQRAGEHKKEIDNGVATHPLVIHFCEEHQGRKQEVIFRVLSSHLTALERQTVESINILAAGRDLGDILNNKSEWGELKYLAFWSPPPKELPGRVKRKVRRKIKDRT